MTRCIKYTSKYLITYKPTFRRLYRALQSLLKIVNLRLLAYRYTEKFVCDGIVKIEHSRLVKRLTMVSYTCGQDRASNRGTESGSSLYHPFRCKQSELLQQLGLKI